MRFIAFILAASALAAQAPAPGAAAAAPVAPTPERLIQQRHFDDARTILGTRLAKNKADADAMYWMGRAAYAEVKIEDAIDWFEKAVKIDDKNAAYHLWLGNAVGDKAQNASKIKQPFLAKKVKSAFERAIGLDPTLVGAREGLVDFYSQAPGFMGGSMTKAREQAAEIAKLSPLRGQLALARIARQDKDLAAEEKAYQGALTVAPDSASGYYQLAGFYRRQQRWDDAFATYDRLMKAKPDEIVAHLGWGAVSALSGKSYDRGEKELKHFIGVATLEKVGNLNLAGAHFRLGQIYEKTNRRDQARTEYTETLKINPRHPEAKKALELLK